MPEMGLNARWILTKTKTERSYLLRVHAHCEFTHRTHLTAGAAMYTWFTGQFYNKWTQEKLFGRSQSSAFAVVRIMEL